MIELTFEQRAELGQPEPTAIDPQTHETYVLVRLDVYRRLKCFLPRDEFDPEEAATLVNDMMAADDAADPLLESYQHYGQRR